MKTSRTLSSLASGVAIAATPLLAAGLATPVADAASAFATYDAIVAFDNCSGSIVRYPGAADSDMAVVMTNGHCLPTMPTPNTFVSDQPSSRTVTVLGGNDAHTVTKLGLDRLMYATMTGTDLALYRSTKTYAQLKATYGITARPVSTTHPVDGTAIDVPSGYWKQHFSCAIDGFVYRLDEAGYTMKDSIRYTTCEVPHGSSGSPVVEQATGTVIGINNTGNDDGGRCTMNNPCEIDPNGVVRVEQGQGYGQEVYQSATCITGSKVDLNKAGCVLYGASGSTTPTPPPTGSNLLVNGGFEDGVTGWAGTTGAITSTTTKPAHTGTWKAWLGGNGNASSETLSQSVSIPATAATASLTYWVRIDTAETGSTVYDSMKTQVVSNGAASTLASVSNVDASGAYVQKRVDLSAYRGKTVQVRFAETEDAYAQTSFVLDDVAVTVG